MPRRSSRNEEYHRWLESFLFCLSATSTFLAALKSAGQIEDPDDRSEQLKDITIAQTAAGLKSKASFLAARDAAERINMHRIRVKQLWRILFAQVTADLNSELTFSVAMQKALTIDNPAVKSAKLSSIITTQVAIVAKIIAHSKGNQESK